jgi:hypothetical protein
MTKPDAREEARAADDATISSAPRWVPVWATPNVTFDDPVETSHAALVPLHDGGTDNGAPGPREDQTTPVYYAAFVIDPDGKNMEAVFRGD